MCTLERCILLCYIVDICNKQYKSPGIYEQGQGCWVSPHRGESYTAKKFVIQKHFSQQGKSLLPYLHDHFYSSLELSPAGHGNQSLQVYRGRGSRILVSEV